MTETTTGDRPTGKLHQHAQIHSHDRPHEHSHSHSHDGSHSHTHGAIDPEIATSERGLWAVKLSFVGLVVTAACQGFAFWLSGSVALFADLIHNVGDAVTAVPLGVAFLMARWKPSDRFGYGYGKTEDLAGLAVVALIFLSALVAGYETILRFLHPQPLEHLSAIAIAAAIGFVGNETVALFRIRVGKEINSAALVADGYHARADGLISLSVVCSALGMWLGYPQTDPIVSSFVTVLLLQIVWQSGKTLIARLLDGVEPETIAELHHAAGHISSPCKIDKIRARWMGHRLHAEIAIALDPALSIAEGNRIAEDVRSQLQHHLPYLANVIVQIGEDRDRP